MLSIDKEHTINWTLLYAFLIALGAHLMSFWLFSIQPFKLYESSWIFPQVRVDSDPGTLTFDVFNADETLPAYVLIPKIPFPQLPEIKSKSFLSAEERRALFKLPIIEMDLTWKPIEMVPIGVLDGIVMTENSFPITTDKVTALHQERAVYTVILDQRTGKIIHWSPTQPFETETLAHDVKEAFLRQQWKVSSLEPFVSGQMEVIVTRGMK